MFGQVGANVSAFHFVRQTLIWLGDGATIVVPRLLNGAKRVPAIKIS
jgi:hypothetical protein